MLTIKSNFNTFTDRLGQKYTVEDLQKLSKNVITTDIINLRGNMSYGYTDAIAKEVIKKLTINKSDLILIINDLSVEMYNALTDAGYTNIIIAYGKWTKTAMPEDDDTVYNIMTNYIKANFKEQIKIIKLKEIFNMKYKVNAIIANPPYGAIGANITKTIIEKVDFDEYINLLPTNDYKTKDLYKHVNCYCGKHVWGNLAEAKTLPDICMLSKNKNNFSTFTEYELANIFDSKLRLFWDTQLTRPTSIEQYDTPAESQLSRFNGQNSFCVGVYTSVNLVNDLKKSLDYFKANPDINKYIYEDSWRAQGKVIKKQGDPHTGYIWNLCNPHCPITDVFNLSNGGENKKVLSQIVTVFKTECEKNNFVNWWYSAELSGKPARSGLASILISLMHKPTHCKFDIAIPRVDWTRAWTDLEILLDYGYSEKEANDILALGEMISKHRHNYGDQTFN